MRQRSPHSGRRRAAELPVARTEQGLPAGSPVLFAFILLFAHFLFMHALPRKLLYPSETVADYGVWDAFQYLVGFEEHECYDRREVENEGAQG